MTTGTRIAQKRKELGLSQEQLGDRLGVSRQSIYKWESDAALPEVEKLVALARLFSVTVGWLLGVEEDGAPDGALSEAQLHLAEEIAARYRPRLDRRGRLWLCAAAAVIVAAFLFLFIHLGQLQKSCQELERQLDTLRSELNSHSTVIMPVQPEDSLAICRASLQTADLAANTVTFAVDVVPKTYQAGMRVLLLTDSDGVTAEQTATEGENRHFTGTVTCPLSDSIVLSFALISDESYQTEIIDSYGGLWSASFRYALTVWNEVDTSGRLPSGVYMSSKRPSDSPLADLPTADYTTVRMGLFCDNTLVKWLTPLAGPPEGYRHYMSDDGNEEYVYFRNEEAVSFQRGHRYALVTVATDEYGRDAVFPGFTYAYSSGLWAADTASASANPVSSDDWHYG